MLGSAQPTRVLFACQFLYHALNSLRNFPPKRPCEGPHKLQAPTCYFSACGQLQSVYSTPVMDETIYLTSDDLDDVRGLDLWAPEPPVVAPVPRGFALAFARVNGLSHTDPEFLALVAPDLYLQVGSMAHAFAKGVSQGSAYVPVPGARKAMEHSLYQTGVR